MPRHEINVAVPVYISFAVRSLLVGDGVVAAAVSSYHLLQQQNNHTKDVFTQGLLTVEYFATALVFLPFGTKSLSPSFSFLSCPFPPTPSPHPPPSDSVYPGYDLAVGGDCACRDSICYSLCAGLAPGHFFIGDKNGQWLYRQSSSCLVYAKTATCCPRCSWKASLERSRSSFTSPSPPSSLRSRRDERSVREGSNCCRCVVRWCCPNGIFGDASKRSETFFMPLCIINEGRTNTTHHDILAYL